MSQCHYLTGILSLNKQILISLIIKVLTIFKKIMSLKVTNLHSVSIWFSFYFCQVFQVRKISGADNGKIFAMKVLKKVRGHDLHNHCMKVHMYNLLIYTHRYTCILHSKSHLLGSRALFNKYLGRLLVHSWLWTVYTVSGQLLVKPWWSMCTCLSTVQYIWWECTCDLI